MNEQQKNNLNNILNELPDENSWLDYKIIPYPDQDRAEFIRDLCAFLNSNESYGKDKFIVFGINNDKQIIGLQNIKMQDDSWYQHLADYIFPRPSILSGSIKWKVKEKELDIGYILIYGSNVDRVYEINRHAYYGNPHPNSEEEREEKSVYPSTAWIRMGSCKRYLSEYDRRKIYDEDRKNNMKSNIIPSQIYNLGILNENNKILKSAIIFGGWDENNENDKSIISEFIGKPYNEWIAVLRANLKSEDTIFEFKNNKWKVKDKYNRILEYATDYFKDEIELFKSSTIKILSERNPKFDLSPDKRNMANIYNKLPKYSKILRESVAETLPILAGNYREFKNCKSDVENLPFLVTREVLENDNWEIWAGLNELLPLLAEASPDEFLKQIDNKLKKNPSTLEKLFTEKEIYVTTYNYSTGLYWSLELIAWESRNLIQACMLLSKISIFDMEEAIKHIANIILPWYPQTKAPIENKVIVVRNILKEQPLNGWKLLMDLMPGKITIASPSYKPKWINIIENTEIEVLQSEYWEQITIYIDLAISFSKTDTSKLCDLIDLLDDLPKELFDKIYNKLSSSTIINLKDTRKYVIWNHLEDLIVWHQKFTKSESSISKEALKRLTYLSSRLKPKDLVIFAKRFFRKDTWHIIDDRKDYKIGEKKLHEIQIELCNKILEINFEKLLHFIKSVEDSYIVGICLAELNIADNLENKILDYLQSKNLKLLDFAKGYVYKKFNLKGNDWMERLDLREWKKEKKLNFLLELPCVMETFKIVESVMNKDADAYWKKIDIRFVKEVEELNYAIEKLLESNRPDRALWIINSMLIEKKNCEYNKEIAIKCLREMLNNQEKINNMSSYDIVKVIKDLQNSDVSKEELFNIEWAYLPLLNGEDARPITIEQTIATNPEKYNEILCLAYKPHSLKENPQKIDEKIATNAYRLLNQWRFVPGTINGLIDKDKLNKWFLEMKEICAKSDRLEVGLSNFGKVLYHSPKDKDGFWIDKNVADILNQDDADIIRSGFKTEAFNSVGVVNYDSEGSAYENLAKKYQDKAEAADKEGYYNLAREMRKLSETFKHEAERARDHYNDFE